LAWRARIYIPVNATSTTAFEAAEMGARVVLVDIDGVKKTSISDRVASARANSLEALPWVVRSQIIASEAEVGRLPGDEK
jgi:MoxR-like ATPase